MNALTGSLDVFRTCVSFWPLDQRLLCPCLSKRWREAAKDHQLWTAIEVPNEQIGLLPKLLAKHHASVRRLQAVVRSFSFTELPASLWRCTSLTHLMLHGIRCPSVVEVEDSVTLPSLRVLALEFAPYFVLSNYSHHTGVTGATIRLHWINRAFPSLEELTCDYLHLSRSADAAVAKKLRTLSFVAVVRDFEEPALWNSPNCRRDLDALAHAAPHLVRIVLRDPRPNFGRVCRRPNQSDMDLRWMCRRFCATSPQQLRGVCRLFPALEVLEVATLHDERSMGLAVATTEDEGAASHANSAAGLPSFLGLGDRRIVLRLGGAEAVVQRYRAVAALHPDRISVETLNEDCNHPSHHMDDWRDMLRDFNSSPRSASYESLHSLAEFDEDDSPDEPAPTVGRSADLADESSADGSDGEFSEIGSGGGPPEEAENDTGVSHE